MFNNIKDLIIQDQRRTIERLQEELRDKSNFIFNLMTLIDNNEVYGMATKHLKAENARLKSCLQEIKAIAESAMAKQQEYKKDYEQILNLITKAESKG